MRETMRNSVIIACSNSMARPARTWASAIFMEVGDLARMVASVSPHQASPVAAAAPSASITSSTVEKRKQASIAARLAVTEAGTCRDIGEAFEDEIHRLTPAQSLAQLVEARGGRGMGGKARGEGVALLHALAGQGEIGADLAGDAGQEIGAADIGEEADADLGHGEDEFLAATTWLPLIETPTPPPMTMPSMSET